MYAGADGTVFDTHQRLVLNLLKESFCSLPTPLTQFSHRLELVTIHAL